MSIPHPRPAHITLFADGSVAPPANRAKVMKALLERGHDVSFANSVAPASPPVGVGPASPPVAEATDRTTIAITMDGLEPDAVLAKVASALEPAAAPTPSWKPWFPVIDYSRCTNCMQCLSFCLFDVYGVSTEAKIQVQNQSNCKTECPACSRVCPEVAIMFPKYRHGPINGEDIKADDVRREAMKVDISALLGGDIYSMLRDRSVKAKSRFSKERDDNRALTERQNCLIALKKDLDVPPEVLAALPSPDEILRKAEAAKARGEAARAAAAAVSAAGTPAPHTSQN